MTDPKTTCVDWRWPKLQEQVLLFCKKSLLRLMTDIKMCKYSLNRG